MTNFNQPSLGLRRHGTVALAAPAQETMNLLSVLAFLLLHIPLAILMSRVPAIATLHAFAILGIGLWWALSEKSLEKVAYVGAYIAGSEVLWRMTSAIVFWEIGKYGIAAIFTVALLRRHRFRPKAITWLYLLLLLPSVMLTIFKLDLSEARSRISFYISGHVALIASIWFFSNLTLTRTQLQKLFMSVVGPIFGVASIAAFGIVSAAVIRFTDESNFETSGGFGPNQVSAVLGLGALLGLLYILDDSVSQKLRLAIFGVMLILAAQSALTFSRGGLYNAVGAALLASLYLVRDARYRWRLLLVMVVVILVGNFIILPRLDAFSGGALLARFQDTRSTGRIPIIISDLKIWKDNLFFGVGLGQSTDLHADLFRSSLAHTEFSRLLSEHGIFGLFIVIILIKMAVQNLTRAQTLKDKALVAALLGWSFLFMMNAAMRLAAPSLLIGITFNKIFSGERDLVLQLKLWLLKKSYRRVLARKLEGTNVVGSI
jgi:hypothetical protein